MEGVIVSDNRIIQEPSTIIAQRAYLVSDPRSLTVTLRLENGSTHTVNLKERNYRKLSFSTYDVNLDLAAAILEARDKKASTEMTFGELLDSMRRAGTDNEVGRELAIELHKKITLPLSCLILGILAIPLGVQAHRSVKSRGFTVGMITVMIYYLLQLGGEALVETGYLPPAPGIWAPDLLFGCAAVYLFVKASREEPLQIQRLMDEISLRVQRWRRSA
jgi:lipopolysaccharide export system permease protein